MRQHLQVVVCIRLCMLVDCCCLAVAVTTYKEHTCKLTAYFLQSLIVRSFISIRGGGDSLQHET